MVFGLIKNRDENIHYQFGSLHADIIMLILMNIRIYWFVNCSQVPAAPTKIIDAPDGRVIADETVTSKQTAERLAMNVKVTTKAQAFRTVKTCVKCMSWKREIAINYLPRDRVQILKVCNN